MTPSSVLPLRPLTIGELLDSAVALVRTRSRTLFIVAAALALAEQSILRVLRNLTDMDITSFSFEHVFGWFWWVLVLGFGFEAMIINALGPLAGRIAASDLTGKLAPRPAWTSALVTAPVAGVTTLLSAIPLLILWPIGYAVFGLSGAVSALERRGPFSALGRAASLAVYSGARASGVRILGYLGWLLLRLGFYLGVTAGLSLLPAGLDRSYYEWIVMAGLALANTMAYATLAMLDAVVALEVRIRSEALDVWIGRSVANGSPLNADLLAVRR